MWGVFTGPRHPTANSQAVIKALEETRDSIRSLRSEIASQISFQSFDLINEIEAIKAQLAQLSGIDNTDIKLSDRIAALDHGLNSRLNSADTAIFELKNTLAHIENNVFASLALQLTNRMAVLENAVLGRLNEVGNLGFEGTNQILSAQGATQNNVIELGSLAAEVRNLLQHLDTNTGSRLNEIVFAHLPSIVEQLHEAAALGIEAGRAQGRIPSEIDQDRPKPTHVEEFDKILARAKRDFPTVYGEWRTRLDEMAEAFADTKVGNAANAADVYSRLFRNFVNRHIRGPVLDIGCGPFGRAYYLEDYPAQLISGIEPLPFPTNEKIQILRGISEYLPFADSGFGTVISGTSLDHCLDLEQSLTEMMRVLSPNGVALLWIGSIPGSPEFKPHSADFSPADKFHLFHFDIAWFEPMLEKRFEILDRVKLDRAGYSHVFYCLRPIAGSQGAASLGAEANATTVTKTGQRSRGKHDREAVGE